MAAGLFIKSSDDLMNRPMQPAIRTNLTDSATESLRDAVAVLTQDIAQFNVGA